MIEELYHWTHRKNYRSIGRSGLLTSFALGRVPLVWACSERRVLWAVGHVAERHGWNHDDLILFRLYAPAMKWRRTCWRGVYTTGTDIPADLLVGVRFNFLDPFLHLNEPRPL